MDDDKRNASEADQSAQVSADAESASLREAATGAREAAEALAAENQALRAQAEELNDRNLRLVAEMENLRRRTERDKSEFAKYAISEFARDILGVGDNLRRAIEAVPKDAVASDPNLSVLIEGVEVTERDLLKVLERFQVKRFDPLGEPFNPHLHEAMTKVDVPNVPADTIIQTIHAGYMIGDRILRPAAVIVAKGGVVAEPVQRQPEAAEDPIPPGAMRVPNDAVSSSAPPRQESDDAAFRSRPGGMSNQDVRRSAADRQEHLDERVATFRRARQNGNGNGGGGYDNQRQQGQNRSSPLHKPVIGGGGGGKQDW